MKNLKKVGEIMQVYVVPYHERQPRNVLITKYFKSFILSVAIH